MLPYETRGKTGRTSAKVRATMSHRTFRNERTRSTPLDPKLMFWCVPYHYGAFGTLWLPYETRCKTGRTSAKGLCLEVASEFFATNAPDPPRWTLNSCFGVFRTILVHLGPFGCLTNSVQNRPNKCKTSCHKVTSEFFATNAPDPSHWILNSYYGAFGIVFLRR